MGLAPFDINLEHVKRRRRIWDMIIHMIRIDVECHCELVISLESQTFIVTRDGSPFGIKFDVFRRKTLDLLLLVLTFASDEHP